MTQQPTSRFFCRRFSGFFVVASFFCGVTLLHPGLSFGQTDSTWIGGAGSWFTPGNWDTGSVPNGSHNVFLDSDALTNSVVDTGINSTIDIERLTVDTGDTLNIQNNSDFRITTNGNATSGAIINNGQINLTNSGNLTDLIIKNDVSLSGSGTVSLGGSSNNSRIVDDSGSDGHLTNSSTIQGRGQIGANTLQLTNTVDGVISANVGGQSLVIDTNANGMINQGQLVAINGGNLSILGSTAVNNGGGTIRANDGSTVTLGGLAAITGGTIDGMGTGSIEIAANQTATISGATLQGNINQNNNTDLFLNGSIVNSSTNFNVTNAGNLTDVVIDGATSLSGGGSLTLSGSSNNSRILDQSGDDGVLTIVNNTLQGHGSIGVDTLQIVNQTGGLIDANASGKTLTVDPRTGGNVVNTGTMRASSGGELVLDGLNGGSFQNTGGQIEAQDGSTVQLKRVASVVGGELKTVGSGKFVVRPNENAELTDLTSSGTFNVENNSDLELLGTISNQGSLNVNNAGNSTDIQIESNVTLNGGGTLTLGGSAGSSRILDEVGSATGFLTHANHTIQGQGMIGGNRLTVDNQGLIDANDASGTLTLDPRNADAEFTNSGTLRASNGGELVLNGSGGGRFLNSGGNLEAQDGSTVRLISDAQIVGGNLDSFGSGQFVVGPNQNGSIKDITFDGQFNVLNNTDLDFQGTIDNRGAFALTNAGNQTDIQIESDVTLTGGGSITLGGSANNSRILDETGTKDGILRNIDNTIQGRGAIGFDRLEVSNGGLIDANDSTGSLNLDPRATGLQFTNTGTMRASNGGQLTLDGTNGGQFLNTGGRIEAQNGSTVRLQSVASVVGGDLESFGTGTFVVGPNQNAELSNLRFNGNFRVENNSDLELFGTIENQGEFLINNAGNATDLQIETNVSLTGGGNISLGGSANVSRILDEVGSADGVLRNVDNTIRGFGQIGANRLDIINESGGTISANTSGKTLALDNRGTVATNAGRFLATNSGILSVADNLNNDGFIQSDSLIDINGDLTNNVAGTLMGIGEIEAATVFNSGRIAPGNSVGTLTLDSSADFSATSTLDIEIDSSGADLLAVLGDLTLDGELELTLLDSFLPNNADTFTIATANTAITGAFTNVANGGTLFTTDGGGHFTVNYGTGSAFADSSIVLSDFTASSIPEPSTVIFLLAMLGGTLFYRKRMR